jgi:4-hydroxybenzoate polyprenyltransferase
MGSRTKLILTGVALATAAAWTATGTLAGLAWPYYAGVAAAAGHMLWQVRTMDVDDRANLTRRFVSNQWVGWAMLAGSVAGRLLQ